MDSTVPRERGLIIPREDIISQPQVGEVIFEKVTYDLLCKDKITQNIKFGVISVAGEETEAEARPESFNACVAKCKKVLERAADGVDFILVCGGGSFVRTRAALIAAKECTSGAAVFALIQPETALDGWQPLAQLITVQALKCDGVLLDCGDGQKLIEYAKELAEHTKIAIGVWCETCREAQGVLPYVSHIVLKNKLPYDEALAFAQAHNFFQLPVESNQEHEALLAVSGGEVWYLDSVVDISESIPCDENFEEALLLAEQDEAPVTKVEINDQNALDVFEMGQYMLQEPVAICSEDEEIFAKAVRMFCGVALYDGTGDIGEERLRQLSQKYGLIIL